MCAPRPRLHPVAALVALGLACSDPTGTLELRIVDAASGRPTPARVELLDASGTPWIPDAALLLTYECEVAPLPEWLAGFQRRQTIDNPHTGTQQFYLAQPTATALPAGSYRLRVFKGIEYGVAEREVRVGSGTTTRLEVALERWSDLPSLGWVGADDHLHITRLTDEDDQRIAAWLAAEDLQVGNLLQMGTWNQVGVTPQRAFGDEGAFSADGTLLLAGQEHPRTHFLGHAIILGARALVDFRDTYIVYERGWREAARLGGIAGFAHWGLGPASDGLAIDAPRGLLTFLEVLQFEFPHYEVWYALLDLGIRLTPTAGTDFPCGPWSVPGRERFYTRVEGPLDRENWLEGIRRGRTFVTNGPLLELHAGRPGAAEARRGRPAGSTDARGDGDADIGDTLRLETAGPVRMRGRVRFDPSRDAISAVELLLNGEPIPAPTEEVRPGEIRFDVTHELRQDAWLALRVSGDKVGEAPYEAMNLPGWLTRIGAKIARGASIGEREAYAETRSLRPSAAHTAPIWIRVADGPSLVEQSSARARAGEWLARLDALEARLSDAQIEEQAIWDGVPYSDGVPTEHLRRNRAALLRAIGEARARYRDIR
jgi:hypothetical protein